MEIMYLSLCCHHQNHSCIKMGSNEGQSHKTVSTHHNRFQEKGEPKQAKPSFKSSLPSRLPSLLVLFRVSSHATTFIAGLLKNLRCNYRPQGLTWMQLAKAN